MFTVSPDGSTLSRPVVQWFSRQVQRQQPLFGRLNPAAEVMSLDQANSDLAVSFCNPEDDRQHAETGQSLLKMLPHMHLGPSPQQGPRILPSPQYSTPSSRCYLIRSPIHQLLFNPRVWWVLGSWGKDYVPSTPRAELGIPTASPPESLRLNIGLGVWGSHQLHGSWIAVQELK